MSAFTATELAQALGITRQAAKKQLARFPTDRSKSIRGQNTPAWSLDALPQAMRERLEALRLAKSFANIETVVEFPVERFVPRDSNGNAIPLARLDQCEIDKAELLRRALSRCLAHPEWTGQELETAGVEDYMATFGHEVSPRNWSRLFHRTIDRDNGLGEWYRIELYISGSPKFADEKASNQRPTIIGLETLDVAISGLRSPGNTTAAERDYIWLRACDQLKELLECDCAEKEAKRTIVSAMENLGCMGKSLRAVRRNFLRKWKAYVQGGGRPSEVKDKRAEANARRKKALPEQDRLLITAAIVDCEGRASQGWREVRESGRLSPETTSRFIENPRVKSYIPESVRRDTALDARKAVEARRRPRNVSLNGAYIPRDPEGLRSGDSFCADDCTLPVYHWNPDPDAPGGFVITRGQFIPMICERSWLVMSFLLHSEKSYNSRIIRSLITKTHDDWGLPRRRFRFERGIWKSSKILTGDQLDITHTELGLREFGIAFSHAQWARGKMAERVLGIIQNKLERLPGYSSRNEITDPNEPLARQLREIESKKVHPRKYLLSRDELTEVLTDILADYNSTHQEGKWCDGNSPLEQWNALQAEEGTVHLGLEARYLLAHHRLRAKVQPKGIKLRKSLGGGLYANSDTGRLAGREVLVWVNPDQLDYITVTEIDRNGKPLFIPRIGPVSSIDADSEQYKRAKALADAHNGYGKTIYRSVKPLLADHNFRRLAADRATVKMGEELESGMERVQAERKSNTALNRRISRQSRDLGISVRTDRDSAPGIARGLELIAEAIGKTPAPAIEGRNS